MNLSADVNQSVSFLAWYRAEGPWVLTAIAPDKRMLETVTFKVGEEKQLEAWLAKSNTDKKWNIYFSVNPTLCAVSKKAEKKDIASLSWLHTDIDPEPGRDLTEQRHEILADLQGERGGLPEPTCIIFSGGGYQAFWRLKEPLPLTPENTEDAERYNQQIDLLLGADACHNVDRIMRLPGTINWPNAKKRERGQTPVLAEAVTQTDNVYPLTAFTKAPSRQDNVTQSAGGSEATKVEVSGNIRRVTDLDELPKELPARCKVMIVQGLDPDAPLLGDNSRSAWLFCVVCSLVRASVDDDTIYAIITDPDYGISESVLDKGSAQQIHRYAIRQIRKAKEDKIAPELAELNETYAIVEDVGGKFRVVKECFRPSLNRHEVTFLQVEGFKNTYCNRIMPVIVGQDANGNDKVKGVPLGKWWLEHEERRTYSDVIFFPGREFKGSMNLWRGFGYNAIPGDCSLYLEHLRKVLCNGVQEHYDYLVNWMANAVQKPHLAGQVAVVLKGLQGTGKGTVAKHFGKLWGVHFKHVTNPDHVTGKFNSVLHDAVFVFADECFRTSKTHVSALKALITEDTIRVEPKGVDSIETRNCMHMMMATNEDFAVHAGLDDRRFFVLELGKEHKRDSKYFAAIQKQMDDGGYEALLHHLLNVDLAPFEVRTVPRTTELQVQQQLSMNDIELFWFSCLEDGMLMPAHGSWHGTVVTDELATSFLHRNATDDRGLASVKMRLGRLFKKMCPGYTRFQKSGRSLVWEDANGRSHTQTDPWYWELGPLEDCRAKWVKEYGPQDWPEIRESDDDDGDGDEF
tara:strand:- start:862 stop:3258 length:2397 start_codon:yes stop_codon:yes gene_type:complete